MFLVIFIEINVIWGISSNGRAPALHAGSTGIDTRILQSPDFPSHHFFISVSSFLFFLFSHFSFFYLPIKLREWTEDDDLGMSDDSGDTLKSFLNFHGLITEVDGNI